MAQLFRGIMPQSMERRKGFCPFFGALLAVVTVLNTGFGAQVPTRAPVQWRAVVVAVHDGDSLTIREAGRSPRRIRIEGIDAPELQQPFGIESRDALTSLTLNKSVEVHYKGHDRYGRMLARIVVD